MVREIIKYPTPPSTAYATDVRVFNEEIVSLIDDLKETIEANQLDGLAAFQIGSYYNVVVIKNEDGSFLELLNPRLIKTEGKITTVEKTAYFGELSATVTRHDKISVVYEDREGKNNSLEADGEMSVLLQRKLDYTFGSTFLQKLSKEEKKRFEQKLEFGIESAISELCPTTFFRDKVMRGVNFITLLLLLNFLFSFFVSTNLETTLWNLQVYGALIALLLTLFYILYGQYEGKKYSGCTSCQIGNIIGTALIALVKISVIMAVSYIFMA
ncbi:MAG: peptide deformylase [Campylobacterales bacterium]|nr:peptide deformylase [Campylobacterales bacterium]